MRRSSSPPRGTTAFGNVPFVTVPPTERTSHDPRGGHPPTRRRVLRVGMTVLGLSGLAGPGLAGCTTSSPDATPATKRPAAPVTTPPPPPPDPDLPVLSAAVESERHLLSLYTAALERLPDLRDDLEEFVRRHEEHLAALTALVGPEVDATAAGLATTAPSTTPPSRSETLAALVAAEKAAVTDRDKDLRAVQGADHARLLAVIGACEATHVVALDELVEKL